MTRRDFVTIATGLSGTVGVALGAEPPAKSTIKALAFDAFTVLDPRPVVALAQELFPEEGAELSTEWRARQFEYTWLRVAARQYADFWQVSQEALVFAAKKIKLELGQDKRNKLMNAYLELKAWPDAAPALRSLKTSGFRLAFLSNFTPRMLAADIQSAGLVGVFEHALSTDQVRTYKPDPRAYQLGTDMLKLKREQILFVAFAGWDAAGAKLFGYPTFWVNRLKLPMEELGATPDAAGETLAELAQYLA
jgi:2-haloacid dehalogenase